MMRRTRLRISAYLFAAALALPGAAAAEAPRPLSEADARHYSDAFAATARGDFIDARMVAGQIRDKSLLGYLSFRELMHPSAHTASFDELSGWLARFRELPVANRIFSLAAKRRPADAPPPPAPAVLVEAPRPKAPGVADRGRPAREAFYAGDVDRALRLARASGESWIGGLASWRLNDFSSARSFFHQVAQDETQDVWLRSAGAYWAARAASAQGDAAGAHDLLRKAAAHPETFYGMIAQRQVRLLGADPIGQLVMAAYRAPGSDLAAFVRDNPRAHRAAALAQLGRGDEARQELAAGLAQATSPQEQQRWTGLLSVLNGALASALPDVDDYPTPQLTPVAGFTVDKALVYAVVRQESRFNPLAVSRAGAVGLMQLMPDAAARAAGDDKLKNNMTPLFEPSFNLRVGQDYLSWLMERGVGYDILRTVAAYNGGPGMVAKTQAMLGAGADSLLIIECLPALETRNYVEKVMAGYWSYKRLWGEDARTLDALAAGSGFIDARLDLPETGRSSQTAARALQVGMR